MSRAMRKCVLCHVLTTKAQISLRIRGSLISAFAVRCLDSIIYLNSIAEISTLASFCGCEGRFVSCLVGKSRRHVLSCRGSMKHQTATQHLIEKVVTQSYHTERLICRPSLRTYILCKINLAIDFVWVKFTTSGFFVSLLHQDTYTGRMNPR